MNELPEGWEWATLGEIAETQLGKMLSKKSKTGVRSRPYLRNINVQWHRIDLHNVPEMDFTEEESAKYNLVPGDLLVCEGGEVGRTATWLGTMESIHFQKALHRVRPLGGVEPKYLEYAMRWSADTDRFAPLVTGSTIAHLPQQALRQVRVPLPPFAEQGRIVAAIEEHFSVLDAAEISVASAARKLGLELTRSTQSLGIRAVILAAAFSGRLVPQDPSDEPASQLLERIAAGRAAGGATRRKKAAS